MKKQHTLKPIIKYLLLACTAFITLTALFIAYGHWQTESLINRYREQVSDIGHTHKTQLFDPQSLALLPEPVQRYFHFAFPHAPQKLPLLVSIQAQGDFRRPLMTNFVPTTVQQILVTSEPALMFDATTQMPLGSWARAFDVYARGVMKMQARICSAVTVVDEASTPALNKTSLQRWLLESSVNPAGLLPGGPVRWEAINNHQARAIVSAYGQEASLIATFRSDGSLEKFQAEEDGDLSTPYHGAGEYVLREDYQLIDGMMIPMSFTIARVANDQINPFWTGRITEISFTY